ncbi:MAG: hypothetical protein K2I70_03600, partial [Bacilli bacterium]|nr:hypothetical protein [Bacilli bacterium]
MIKEYYGFIKDYLELAELKIKYLVINLLSAFFYKGFSLLLPFVGSLIIKYLTQGNAEATYAALGGFLVVYILYNIALYINYRIYGFNMDYCYDKMTSKVLNKLVDVDGNFTRMISKGRLMNSINTDIVEIGDMNDQLSEFFMGLLQIAAVLIIIATINIYLSLIFVLFTLVYIYVRNQADCSVNYYHNKVKIQDDRYTTLLTQIISGLQEIKTFNMLPKLTAKLDIIQKNFIKCYKTKREYCTLRDNDIRAVTYIFRFILYVFLICLIMAKRIDVSVLVLVIAYHEYLEEYVGDLISSTSSIRETNTAVCRINDILNYNSDEIKFGTLDTKDIYGMVELK